MGSRQPSQLGAAMNARSSSSVAVSMPVSIVIDVSTLPDLSTASTSELLDLLSAVGDELEKRGHTRTGTSKLGELMEGVAATVYGGELAKPGQGGWDVLLPDGRRIQVKTRNLKPDVKNRPFPFSKHLDFEIAVLVRTNITTHTIEWAREVTLDELVPLLTTYGDGYRLSMARAAKAGRDITDEMVTAYSALR